MSVTTLWDKATLDFSARSGLVFKNKVLCISQFIQSIRRVAGKLSRDLKLLEHSERKDGAFSPAVIGVCAENSDDLVIIACAILYAGYTYMPLDVNSPSHRIGSILKDIGSSFLITDRRDLQSFLNDGVSLHSITELATAYTDSLDHETGLSRAKQVDPDSAAYCIYTSGSTGQPKGVAVPHSALLNHTEWIINKYEFAPTDRFLFKTPCCFDASIWELFTPLACGACLVVAHTTDYKDPSRLAELVITQSISVLQLVPSIGEFFAQQCNLTQEEATESRAESRPKLLRHLFFGGEPLKLALVHKCAHLAQKITNLYGPTECCIDSVVYTYHPNDEANFVDGYVPIGYPIRNTEAMILGPTGHAITEPGQYGELLLAGTCVAIGYVGKAASKMVDTPFTLTKHNEKAYRTGDFVQWIESAAGDRLLHCLGRREDSQTKLHGYRVDLLEIENCLRLHPFVEAVVATIIQDQLVAFVQGLKIEKAVLLAQCHTHLPQYMVPNEVYICQLFPRLPSGKLNLKAMRELSQEVYNDSASAGRAPMSDLETSICEIARSFCGSSKTGNFDVDMLTPIASIFDSIGIVNFQQQLFHCHGVLVSIQQLYTLGNLNEICEFVSQKKNADRGSSDGFSKRPNNEEPLEMVTVSNRGRTKELDALIRNAIRTSESKLIVIHSSLAHLGLPVQDVCNCIINLVQQYTSYDGSTDDDVEAGFTFLFPAFTFGFCRYGYHHHLYSRSETGILSHFVHEALPGARRTSHPIYSWVVVGRLSRAIEQCDHTLAFGEGSVFAFLDHKSADFLLLGCKHLTQVHYYEEIMHVPYRYHKTFTGQVVFAEMEEENLRSLKLRNHEVTMYVRDLKSNPVLGFKYIDILRQFNAIESMPFNDSFVHFIQGKNLRKCLTRCMETDPNALVIEFEGEK